MLLAPRVSACIVMYESGEKTMQAIESVLASTIPVDLHLVDNSPQDLASRLTHATWPEVHYLPQQKNLGYGAGNNVVLPLLRSQYHIIMNPDITMAPDTIERMIAFMDEHKDVMILTPRVLYENGEEQFVPRRQPTVRYLLSRPLADKWKRAKKWRDAYTLADREITEPTCVQFATGCFIMIRTHLFYQLGGFDKRFFLYHEDSDLSRRVLKHGQIVYHPDFCVTHAWKRASAHSREALRRHIFSTLKFFSKWGWAW